MKLDLFEINNKQRELHYIDNKSTEDIFKDNTLRTIKTLELYLVENALYHYFNY